MRAAAQACPAQGEWLRLIDGEVTENRASELRAHAARCPGCSQELAGVEALVSRIAAPVPSLAGETTVASVMARLDAPAPAPRRRYGLFFLGGAAGLATAAALVLALRMPTGEGERGAFAPRGEEVEWAKKVGVELWAIEDPLRRVVPGASVAASTPIVASYSNVDTEPAWLLAFVLDAGNEVHWLYPAFLDPKSDPESARLEPSTVQRAFADTAVLEGLAPGSVRFVLVVSREPSTVAAIERLAPAERDPDALRVRWPRARIDVLPARVEPRRAAGGR